MADDQLNIKINSDTSGLDKQIASLISQFDKLGDSVGKVKSGLDEQGKASDGASDSIKRTKTEADGLDTGFKDLADHSMMAARGFEVLGVNAGAASAKLAALAEVMDMVGKAAPELLAIGAAVVTMSAAFSQLSSAINIASESQRQLVSVGALLKNQGGDFKANTQAVNEYATSLSKTSVFAKGDFLNAMRAMLVAGVSNNDMLRSQQAAMDLAVAKNISLVDAESELAAAYDGRLLAMKRLGLVTQEEVKNGIPYEELLQRIEQRMSGSAAGALNTYSGKMQNLGNLIDDLKEEFGNALLPVLSVFEDSLRSGVTAMQPLTDEFTAWAKQHLPQLTAGARGFGDTLMNIAQQGLPYVESGMQELLGWLAKVGKDWDSGKTSVQQWAKSIQDATQNVKDFEAQLQPLDDLLNQINTDSQSSGKSVGDFLDDANTKTQNWSTSLGNAISQFGRLIGIQQQPQTTGPGGGWGPTGGSLYNMQMEEHAGEIPPPSPPPASPPPYKPRTSASTHHIPGTSTGGQPKEAYEPAPVDNSKDTSATEARTKAALALANALKEQGAAQKSLQDVLDTGLDTAGLEVQNQQALFDAYLKNESVINTLTPVISAESAALKVSSKAENDLQAAYDASGAKLQVKENALKGSTSVTKDDKAAITNLKDAHEALGIKLGLATTKVNDQTRVLDQNVATVKKASEETNKYAEAQAKMAAAVKTAEESIAKSQTADRQKLADDIATHGQDEATVQAYYDKRLAIAKQAMDETQALYDSADQAEKQQLEAKLLAEIAAYNAAYATEEQAAAAHYNKDYDLVVSATQKLKTVQDKARQDEVDAQLKAQQEAAAQLNTFLDNILVKHQSFGASLKDLMAQISTNYLKQFEQMLIPTGSGVSASIAKAMGLNPTQSPTALSNQQAELTTATNNLTTAQKQLHDDFPTAHTDFGTQHTDFDTQHTAMGTLTDAINANTKAQASGSGSGGTTVNDAGSKYLLQTTGNVEGVSPDSATAVANSAGTDWAALGFADDTGMGAGSLGPGGAAKRGINASGISGALGSAAGVAGGFEQGGIGGGISAGLSADSLAVALGASGPVGLAIGGAVLLGTLLFGGPPPPPPPPDPLQTSGSDWQWIANHQGIPFNAPDGSTVLPNNSNYTADGGTSQSDADMQSYLTNEADQTSLNQAQKDALTKMSTLTNGDTQANALDITKEWNANGVSMIQLSSGIQLSLKTFEADMANYEQVLGANSNSPIFTVNRTAPDFSTTSVGGWTNNPVSGGNGSRTAPIIIQNPTIIGNNVDDLARQIAIAIQKQQTTGFGNQW